MSRSEVGLGCRLHCRFTVRYALLGVLVGGESLLPSSLKCLLARITISNTIRYLITASSDCVARLWSLKTGEVLLLNKSSH